MLYIGGFVVIAIAVVLGIFTGVWGGLVWLVAAGLVVGGILTFGARKRTLRTSNVEPTGTPRGTSSSGTANERVGQS